MVAPTRGPRRRGRGRGPSRIISGRSQSEDRNAARLPLFWRISKTSWRLGHRRAASRTYFPHVPARDLRAREHAAQQLRAEARPRVAPRREQCRAREHSARLATDRGDAQPRHVPRASTRSSGCGSTTRPRVVELVGNVERLEQGTARGAQLHPGRPRPCTSAKRPALRSIVDRPPEAAARFRLPTTPK